MQRTILVAVKDLLFGSKVQESGKRTGTVLTWAPRFSPLREVARERRPDVLVVDLGEPGVLEELAAIRAELPALTVVGFAGHVNEAAIDGARSIGVSAVYTRGQFSARVDQILTELRGG